MTQAPIHPKPHHAEANLTQAARIRGGKNAAAAAARDQATGRFQAKAAGSAVAAKQHTGGAP
jgi:hypothetical protein